MACNTQNLNTNCYVSAQTAYNNASQTILASSTTLSILGNMSCDTGNSIETQNGGFIINKSGVYTIKADVTFTPSAAGTEIIEFYIDEIALPCSINTYTVSADSIYTLHVETTIHLVACCNNTKTIDVVMTGVAGSVTHVCATAIKINPS